MNKTYLSASETLERLCELEPSKHKEQSAWNIAGGIACGGLTAGGIAGINYFEDPSCKVFVGFCTILSGTATILCTLDGILSKYTSENYDGNFYYHNDGFTMHPNLGTKWFGNKIKPVDDLEEIKDTKGFEDTKGSDYLLMNGIKITGKEIVTETEVGRKGDRSIEVTYLKGRFNGRSLKISLRWIKAKSQDLANNVDAKDIIYIMGPISGGSLHTLQLGNAITDN